MRNVLVTGSNGQLGSEIKELVSEGLTLGKQESTFFFTDREALDITNFHAMEEFIDTNEIDIIINCAAYTAVDKAESDEYNADAINHVAVKDMAKLSKEKGLKLIHISTDYVFNGKNYMPYKEDDATAPNGVYGQTKLDGENAILEIAPKGAIIIRTSWVYSTYGANFVKTMLRLGKERQELGVIFDQVGTPTYARDLAQAILDILSHPELDSRAAVQIYHYSNEGVLSWYDFAKEIMRMAKLTCQVNPIETKEYPTPAVRPHYSLLNKAKIKKEFNITIPYWKDSLDDCLRKLGERR
ncbi:MAG: dTDP-4-dehydrorhamnose reductase [Sulfurimonadaceae bacterium]